MTTVSFDKIFIKLLGSPQIYCDGVPIKVSRKRVRALLFYLVVQQSVPRSRLAYIFWPDRDPTVANNNLNIHISYLKNALGESVITSDADFISINPAIASDVQRFDALAGEKDEEAILEALKLFHGPFLDGFSLQNAQPFEQWRMEMEAYNNNLFVDTSISVSQLLFQSKRYETALSVLDAAFKIDPLQEAICRLRMQIFDQRGNRSAVIHIYSELVSLLNSELGCPPAPETSALYQRIISSDDPVERQAEPAIHEMPNTGQQTIFVGRQSILRTLSKNNDIRFTVLQGKSGMGKTRIMNEYIKQHNYFSVPIAFRQQEQDVPYAAIIRCIRSIALSGGQNSISSEIASQISENKWNILCQLVPELNRVRNALVSEFVISPNQMLEAIEQFFSCLIGDRYTVISLDDIHFADDSSLTLLHYLVSQNALKTVQFIATFRPSLARPKTISFFNVLQRGGYLHSIDVGKLDNESLLELLLYYFPDLNSEEANNLISLSDGNPYWMKMIIIELRSGLSDFSGETFFDDLFKKALHSLSPQVLDIIYAMAVIGDSCDAALFDVLCKKTMPTDMDINSVFMELFSANLISRDYDGSIMFAHSKIYEYVVSRVNAYPQKVRALHLLIAEAMEEVYGNEGAGPQSINITEHYRLSESPERCAEHAYRAGSYLLTLGNRKQAISCFKLAYSYLELPKKLDIFFVMYNNMVMLGQNYEANIYIQDAINTAEKSNYGEYLLAYQALKQLSAFPEFQELLCNVTPSYTIRCDENLASMFVQANALNDTGTASPVLRNYILYYRSFYYCIVGDYCHAEDCLWQIIGASIVRSGSRDIAANALACSAIQEVTSIVNMRSNPKIEELIALQEQVMSGLPIKGFLSYNLGMQALLMNVQGKSDEGFMLFNDAITEARRSGDRIRLSDSLTMQALLIHKVYPEKSFSMNYEAYMLAKELNTRYVLVKALTGLVVTCSDLHDAEQYYSELSQLVSQLGNSAKCPKLETAKKALHKKREKHS